MRSSKRGSPKRMSPPVCRSIPRPCAVARRPGALPAASVGAGHPARIRRDRPVAPAATGRGPGLTKSRPSTRTSMPCLRRCGCACSARLEREIGILTDTAQPIVGYLRVLNLLREKADSGVGIRICLPHPDVQTSPDTPVSRTGHLLCPCSRHYVAEVGCRSGCTGSSHTTRSSVPTTRSSSATAHTACQGRAVRPPACMETVTRNFWPRTSKLLSVFGRMQNL